MSPSRLVSEMYRTANSRCLAFLESMSLSRPRNSGSGTVGSTWDSMRIHGSGTLAGTQGRSFSRQYSMTSLVASWIPL